MMEGNKHMKTITKLIYPAFAALAFACFGLSPEAQALLPPPPPDGGYPGFNTAEGQSALFSLTTGSVNTAVGWSSLRSLTEGKFCTGVGGGALLSNTADENTATGAGALFSNTTGESNTANGAFALFDNTIGSGNTANGFEALQNNTTGFVNCAFGSGALFSNTMGQENNAFGGGALVSNITGFANNAFGLEALESNTTGNVNNAFGRSALASTTTGSRNNAFGDVALGVNVTGSNNTAIGDLAGGNITGSGNVCIGQGILGLAGESNTTRIRNVYPSFASARAVYVNSDNKIGTLSSSRRFKDEIKTMDKVSEAILALKPVTFRYKKEIEPNGAIMFGLIAEEVEKVDPELVTRNDKGEVETVRYDAVNAMLLNEFLKEHRTVQEHGAMIVRQQKQIEALTAGLQKVSAQLEGGKPAPQVVNNDQ
jgi:Chaperone of endosialidase